MCAGRGGGPFGGALVSSISSTGSGSSGMGMQSLGVFLKMLRSEPELGIVDGDEEKGGEEEERKKGKGVFILVRVIAEGWAG